MLRLRQVLSALALANLPLLASADATPLELVRVPLNNVNGAAGSDGTLRTTDSWYWGQTDSAPHANLTGYFEGQNQKVISMDRFSSLLKSSSCSSDHKSITYTFKDKTSYQNTKKSWNWVNGATFHSFILTVDIQGCAGGANDLGGGHGRQPYQINGITWNDNENTAVLKATMKTWQDAFDGNRWAFSASSKGLTDAQGNQKRIEAKKSGAIQLAHDFSTKILSKQIGDINVELDCANCNTAGELDFDIDVIPFLIPAHIEGHIQLTPKGVGATAQLAVTVSGQTAAIDQSLNLATVSLPGGFSVAGVASFGPALQVALAAHLDPITASVTATFGTTISIPDSSIAKVDFHDSKNNQLSGWNPTFTPIPPTLQSSFSLSGSLSPEILVALEATVLGTGLSGGVALQAPKLQASLQAQQNTQGGVCGNPQAGLGVQFGLGVGVEADAFGGFGKPEDLPNKLALFTTSANVFTTCITFGSPVAAPTPTDAPAPINTADLAHPGESITLTFTSSGVVVTRTIPDLSTVFTPPPNRIPILP